MHRALMAVRLIPERFVSRQMRRTGSISRKSRVIASNRGEGRESRCGTSQIRNVALAGVAPGLELAGGDRELPGTGSLAWRARMEWETLPGWEERWE